MGKPGLYFLDRAVIQLKQIGSKVPQEAMYFFAYQDADGEVLDGSQDDYSITFAQGEESPKKASGFWSLTKYRRSNSLLVDNPIDRYYVCVDTPGFERGPEGLITVHMAK